MEALKKEEEEIIAKLEEKKEKLQELPDPEKLNQTLTAANPVLERMQKTIDILKTKEAEIQKVQSEIEEALNLS